MRNARVLLAVAPFLLTACSTNPSQAAWERANIDDYTLMISISCFCDSPNYRVTVRDGQVADIEFTKGERARWEDTGIPKTVDDLYAVIDGAGDADSLEVTYDDVGVPTNIAIDPTAFSDDEVTYNVVFDT